MIPSNIQGIVATAHLDITVRLSYEEILYVKY
jgi:hypothetical protein